MDLKKAGISAFIWDFAGKIGSQGVGFIVSIFLTRILEPEEYGLMAMVAVVVAVASIFSDMGLAGSIIQRKRVLPIHYDSVFWFNAFVAIFLSLLLFFLAPIIANFYERPEVLTIARVMSPLFLLTGLATIQNAYFKKKLIFKYLVKFRLTASISSGVLGVYMAYTGFGVWALVAQVLCHNLIYLVLIWYVAEWKPKFNFSFKALKQLWGFGFRMFLSRFLDVVYTKMDVIIIGRIFPAAQLGFFQRAKSFDNMIINYSSGSLMSVLFPLLSIIQNDSVKYRRVVLQVHNILLYVVFLIIGLLYLSADSIFVILFTDKWSEAIPLFKIMVLAGFGYPLSSFLCNILSSRGNSKAFLKLEVLKKIVFTLTFPFLLFYGVKTYLYSYVVAMIICLLINYIFVKKELAMNIFSLINPFLIVSIFSLILIVFQYNFIEITSNWGGLLVHSSVYFILYNVLYYLLRKNSYIAIIDLIKTQIKNRIKN